MTIPVFKPSTEQEKVIAHRGGHLQVIACAGPGKTEAISRRVSSLIEQGVEPAQIVAEHDSSMGDGREGVHEYRHPVNNYRLN
jgi:hypothetical protein